MKTILEVKSILDKKVEEHKKEIAYAESQLSELKNWAVIAKEGINAIQKASKMLILKDKILFHKACAAALNDVKQEIEKE
jgi:hypothetical protein